MHLLGEIPPISIFRAPMLGSLPYRPVNSAVLLGSFIVCEGKGLTV